MAKIPKRDGETLKGIKSIDEYEMTQGRNMAISHRKRVCRCEPCRKRMYTECENNAHVPSWVDHELVPSDSHTEYATRCRHQETLEVDDGF